MNTFSRVIDYEPIRQRRRFRRVLRYGSLGLVLVGVLVGVPAALRASGTTPDTEGWRPGTLGGKTPFADALPLGREPDGVLYACRGLLNDEMHVGRIRPDFAGCHIGFGGREAEVTPFEVLSLTWRAPDANQDHALIGGTERLADAETPFATTPLYVCRAGYMGGVHIGQARPGEKGCSFGFGGKRVVSATYDILQAEPWLTWVPASSRSLPDTTVPGGMEGNEPFYVCRAADKEGLHTGKVKQGPVGCSFAAQGREAVADRFEVLVPRWSGGHAGTVPVGGFLSGREKGQGQFVCRAQSRDTVQIGKVGDALGGCHVGMQSREVVLPDYDVLSQ